MANWLPFTVSAGPITPFGPHAPEYSFSHISFAFPTQADTDFYERHQIWKNVLPTGIKYHPQSDTMFISTPRWTKNPDPPARKEGNYTYPYSLSVPATFSRLDLKTGLLHPYPSWSETEEGDENSIQSVLGFEIDAHNRLWIVDQGRLYWAPVRHEICAAKLLVYNLTDNKLLRRHCFNQQTAPAETSFLNDIVVDTSRNVAYLTDSGIGPGAPPVARTHGQLVIYNYYDDSSRAVLQNHYSTQMDHGFVFFLNGTQTVTTTGADGIALTPDGNWLLWCPLSSRSLYSIDTDDLLDLSNEYDDIADATFKVMTKPGPSDGLFASTFQRPWHKNASYTVYEFYISDIENSAVWRVHIPFTPDDGSAPQSQIDVNSVVENLDLSQWPDTLASDGNGHLLWMANSLSRWSAGEFDWSQKNFFIWKVEIHENSYLSQMPLFNGNSEYYEPGDGPDDGYSTPEATGWKIGVVSAVCITLFLGFVYCLYKVWEGKNKSKRGWEENRARLLNLNTNNPAA